MSIRPGVHLLVWYATMLLCIASCQSASEAGGADAGSTNGNGFTSGGFDPTTGTVTGGTVADVLSGDTMEDDATDTSDGADADVSNDSVSTGLDRVDALSDSTDAADGTADAVDGTADAVDGTADAVDSSDGLNTSDSSDEVGLVDSADTTDGTDESDETDGTESLDMGDGDVDNDGVPDSEDNCVFVPNPEQEDLDLDLEGDACDADLDGDKVIDELDCEPLDGDVFPGNIETCDGKDNNCDDVVDAPGSAGCVSYYIDADGDGAGVSDTEECICGEPAENQVLFGGDCDDSLDTISPWTKEICDGVDDNCNLLVDDGCDDDSDGFCDASYVVIGTPDICPLGGGDCLDWSAAINPNAVEVPANGLDDNCDGTLEGEPITGAIEPDCSGQICTGNSNAQILCALDLCYPPGVVGGLTVSSPTGADLSADTLFGDIPYGAIGHFGSAANDLTAFAGSSYLAISSGQFSHVNYQTANAAPQVGNSLGGVGSTDPFDTADTMNDAVEVTVTLTAPEGATGFTIDYIFLSAEYEEWIGSSFNDRFYIIMNGPQTTGGSDQIINFTNCSDPVAYFDFENAGQKFCYIAINTAFSEACTGGVVTNISGTGYECTTGSSTGWLVTSWPVVANETFTLTFHIHDTSDSSFDSLALIDNFKWQGGIIEQGTASKN